MERAGVEMLHVDVMDGHFVPNITIGVPVVASLRRKTSLLLDVHLMISHPLSYIEPFARAGADLITFHLESESDPAKTIAAIHAAGKRAGVALKPATPAQAVFGLLDTLDMVLVMTVEPGFGGQKFMPESCPKIEAVRREIAARGLAVDLQVDGGIGNATAPLVCRSGANVLVAGSALFGAPDYGEAVRQLRAAAAC